MPLTTEYTTFSRDVLGRYVCNTFDEALVTIDANTRAAAGLPARDDLRPFDFIIIGGGTFGAALAEHLWFRSTNRNERILVLDGGPFLLPEHVQNLPALGLNAGGPRKDHLPQNEVWGLAWNTSDPVGFPGLAYCVGGRSVFWGGWSPRLLDSELPKNVWPQAVLDDLTPKNLPDGRKGYFRQSSDQIGVTETNDFIFGDLHRAMRKRLFEGLSTITDAMDLTTLPDHPAVEYRDTPATLYDLAKVLGIDKLPSPPPPIQTLHNEAKLEAPLAVQGQSGHAGFFPFNKFSTVPLLVKAAREAASQSGFDDVRKRLMVVARCHVIRLNAVDDVGGQRVTEVITERGPLPVSPDAKVIIALGTIESTRLALLSFGSDGKIGRNLMAHLRSNVDIRVPRAALTDLPAMAKALEASALFVKCRHQFKWPDGSPDGVGHFHFQITASGLSASGTDSEAELFKKVPDIDTFDAHKNATDTQIVITIRGIGEMEPKNDNDFGNSVTLDLNQQENDEFQTRRAFVNLQPSARDGELWNAIDNAADDIAKIFANGHKIDVIKNGQVIATNVDPSSLSTILPFKFSDVSGPGRRDGLGTTHHEAGTLRLGEDPNKAVTDPNCRFHNVTNAYVAGPALFPTIGSPNPMLTGIALARRLGDHLMADVENRLAPGSRFSIPVSSSQRGMSGHISWEEIRGYAEHIATLARGFNLTVDGKAFGFLHVDLTACTLAWNGDVDFDELEREAMQSLQASSGKKDFSQNAVSVSLVFSMPDGSDELVEYELRNAEHLSEYRRALGKLRDISFARFDFQQERREPGYAFIAENRRFASEASAEVAVKLPTNHGFSTELFDWIVSHHSSAEFFEPRINRSDSVSLLSTLARSVRVKSDSPNEQAPEEKW